MKLSELSLRDYIAIEAVAHFAGKIVDRDAAWRAYSLADALLAHRERDGKIRDHEIEGLKRRAETAERSLVIFQAAGDYVDRVALTELWELLGADNQTQAVAAASGALPRD